jgi:hypothetical protein
MRGLRPVIAIVLIGLGPALSQAADGLAHCDKSTTAGCAHVCKVVPDVKRVSRTVYSSRTEWICLPKCRCALPLVQRECSETAATCAQCKKPRLRRVLVKRLVVDEKPGFKCVIDDTGCASR